MGTLDAQVLGKPFPTALPLIKASPKNEHRWMGRWTFAKLMVLNCSSKGNHSEMVCTVGIIYDKLVLLLESKIQILFQLL